MTFRDEQWTNILIEALLGPDPEHAQLYHDNAWFAEWINTMAMRILPEMVAAAKQASVKHKYNAEVAINAIMKEPIIITREQWEAFNNGR